MTRRNETFMHQLFVAKHECRHLEKQDVSLSLQVMRFKLIYNVRKFPMRYFQHTVMVFAPVVNSQVYMFKESQFRVFTIPSTKKQVCVFLVLTDC